MRNLQRDIRRAIPVLGLLASVLAVPDLWGQEHSDVSAVSPDQNAGPVLAHEHEENKQRSSPGAINSALCPSDHPDNRMPQPFLMNLLEDQRSIWTTPRRLRRRDLRWGLPALGMTAFALAGDHWVSSQVARASGLRERSESFSNYATCSLIGTAEASYAWGLVTKNEQARETG